MGRWFSYSLRGALTTFLQTNLRFETRQNKINTILGSSKVFSSDPSCDANLQLGTTALSYMCAVNPLRGGTKILFCKSQVSPSQVKVLHFESINTHTQLSLFACLLLCNDKHLSLPLKLPDWLLSDYLNVYLLADKLRADRLALFNNIMFNILA